MKLFFHILLIAAILGSVFGQHYAGGIYDFAENFHGERRGDLGPAAIAGITIGAVAVAAALVVTMFFCYYATVNSNNTPTPANYSNTSYEKANNC